MVDVDVLWWWHLGVTGQNFTQVVTCFFLSPIVLCFHVVSLSLMFNMHVLLPCADFTCLLLFFFFWAISFISQWANRNSSAGLSSWCISSLIILLAGDQAQKPSVRPGEGVCKAVWPYCHLVPLNSWDRAVKALILVESSDVCGNFRVLQPKHWS